MLYVLNWKHWASLAGSHEREKKAELMVTYRDGLLKDTLPFWLQDMWIRNGGFMTARDQDGSLLDSDKGMWQQCRFTWLLATLYNTVEPREEWLSAALHGLEFIDKNGFDEDDRMWFHVTREGAPLRKRRYFYGNLCGYCLCLLCQSNWEIQHG